MKTVWIVLMATVFQFSLAQPGRSHAASYSCIVNRNTTQVASIDTVEHAVTVTNLENEQPFEDGTLFGVAILPDGYAYVANPSANAVYVIDTLNGQLLYTINNVGGQKKIVNEDGEDGFLSGKPVGVAASSKSNERLVYVTSRVTNKLSIINTGLARPEIVKRVTVGKTPIGVAVSHDGDYVYVVNRYGNSKDSKNGSLHVLSSRGDIEWTIDELGKEPMGVAVSPDGERIYVTNRGDDNLSVINTVEEIEETWKDNRIVVGNSPIGVAISPDGQYVFVANRGDGTVSVIQTGDLVDDFEVLETVDVGANPTGVAVTPDGSQVYVTCRGETLENDNNGGVENAGVYVIQTSDFTINDDATLIDEDALPSPASFGQFVGSMNEPLAPTDLEANTVSDTQITLSWTDNASDESGFRIYRKQGPCDTAPLYTYKELTQVNPDTTTYDDASDLDESSTYCYLVVAYNSLGESGQSNTAAATTYPAAPSDLIANAVSSSRVDLTWTDRSSGEAEFIIQRKLASGATDEYKTIGIVSSDVQTFRDTFRLSDFTSYSYRVYASVVTGFDLDFFDDTGEDIAFSNEASATTPLAAPSALSATAYYSEHVDLRWKDNSGAETGFKIERKKISEDENIEAASDDEGATPSEATYSVIGEVAANVTAYRDEDVQTGETYSYRVMAFNETEESAYSNEAQEDTSSSLCFISTAACGYADIFVGNAITAAHLVFLIGMFLGVVCVLAQQRNETGSTQR